MDCLIATTVLNYITLTLSEAIETKLALVLALSVQESGTSTHEVVEASILVLLAISA